DEISIGLADESAARLVVRRLANYGITARRSVGSPVASTTPALLLGAVADCLESDRTAEFAVLARYCDVGDWLTARGIPSDWLTELDKFIQQRAPERIGDWASHVDAVGWKTA